MDAEPPCFFHDIQILPNSCEQIKKGDLPSWCLNLRTPVCEANALPLTPQQTTTTTIRIALFNLHLIHSILLYEKADI